MSYSFYLPHVKKLFSSQKVLTVKELLDLVPRLKQFSIPHDRKDFDFDAFHAKRLDEMDSLLVAIIGISARGVELSMADFEGKRCYRVRAFTPCSIDDWKLTLQLTEALSRKLGVRIKDEYGNEYTADTLNQVDYRHDILAGIKGISNEIERQAAESGSDWTYTLFGIDRPFAVNKHLIDQIISAEDPVAAFSDKITEIQYLEAYPAKQKFMKDKEGVIFGLYTLTETVETILPFKPFVEFANMNIVEPKSIKYWLLNLVVIDGDENDPDSYKVLKIMKYDDFMNALPADRYQFIDGAYVVIDGLDKERMHDIANQIS